MNNKKSKFVILSVIFILVISICGFFIYNFIKENNTYSNIIKSNWNIELPSEYIEIYSDDSGESFLGDGERYHVFKYEDNSNIDKVLDWKTGKNDSIESNVKRIISSLDIPSEYSPTFENQYKYY